MSITAIPPLPAVTGEDRDSARRAAFTEGLRALAGILDASPEVPLPFDGRLDPIVFHFLAGDDPRAVMDAAASALGCPSWAEETRDCAETGGSAYLYRDGTLDGLKVRLAAYAAGSGPAAEVTGADAETTAA